MSGEQAGQGQDEGLAEGELEGPDSEELELDTVSSDEEKQAAAEMGWVDKPDFRGEGGARWKTAKEFLEHGRDVLPVLRHNNKKLLGELESERRERQRLASELRAMTVSVTAIRQAQEDDSKANLAAQKAEIQADLADAVKEQDGERVAELTERLIEIGRQEAAVKTQPGGESREEQARQTQELDPAVTAFVQDNPWYVADVRDAKAAGKDLRRTRMMNLIAAEWRAGGDLRSGRVFLDAVKSEVEKTLGSSSASRQRANPVEGARGSAQGGEGAGSGGKSGRYSELPPEAKRQCEIDIKSLVGPNKRHKTPESYRKAYADTWFSTP